MFFSVKNASASRLTILVCICSWIALAFLLRNKPRRMVQFYTYLKENSDGIEEARINELPQISNKDFAKSTQKVKSNPKFRNGTNLENTIGNITKPKILMEDNKKSKVMRVNRKTAISINYEFTDPSKWTILLTVNNGFYDMFRNWWWHFRKLNITVNVTVIAEDSIVFDKLNKDYSLSSVVIVRSWILNISAASVYNSKGYNEIASTRPEYIKKYLEQTINILYVDVDTVFLKNPFQSFAGNFDMWVQPETKGARFCTGFMAIKSSEKTVKVMKEWSLQLIKKLQTNQPAFNKLLNLHKSDLKVKRLSESKFVGGPTFSGMSPKKRSEVVLLHATFCHGLEQKYECFKKWKLWAID